MTTGGGTLRWWRDRDRDTLLDNLRALRGTSPGPGPGADEHDPWAQIEEIDRDDLTDPPDRF